MTYPIDQPADDAAAYTYTQPIRDAIGGVNDHQTRIVALEAEGGTTVTVDGDPVTTLAIDSTEVTPAYIGASPAAKACKIYASATAQTITSGAAPVIDMNVQDYNDDATVFTVDLPSNSIQVLKSGLYLVDWGVLLNGGSAGDRNSWASKNGGTIAVAGGSGLIGPFTARMVPVRLAADDVLTVSAYITGGSDVTVGSADSAQTYLTVVRIGD